MSTEWILKYGCNPHQKPARIFMESGAELPLEVLNGRPGYINFLDALNGWQLVRELKGALGLPAATSFKHVSPAGAAVGLPLSDALRGAYFLNDAELSPLACAYARARGTDRLSSFGDWVALSDPCDVSTAKLIAMEVSDGVIAPGYEPEALAILREKKHGEYAIIQIDPNYEPAPIVRKHCFGITFEQKRNAMLIDASLLTNIVTRSPALPEQAVRDLLLALITLKYTQSNSVCYALGGQTIGVGAGQQSRLHCTQLAGDKADLWMLRQHPSILGLPKEKGMNRSRRDQRTISACESLLTEAMRREWLDQPRGVSLASDAFFPFEDNIERAVRSGVKYIAQPGGSVRDADVIAACDRYGVTMVFTGVRLFHH